MSGILCLIAVTGTADMIAISAAFWKLVNFRNPSLSVFFHVLGPNEIISKSKPCLIRLDKLSTPRLVTCSGG